MRNERQNKAYLEIVLAMIDEYHITEFYELIRYLDEGEGDKYLELLEWCVENSAFVDTLFVSRKRWVAEL